MLYPKISNPNKILRQGMSSIFEFEFKSGKSERKNMNVPWYRQQNNCNAWHHHEYEFISVWEQRRKTLQIHFWTKTEENFSLKHFHVRFKRKSFKHLISNKFNWVTFAGIFVATKCCKYFDLNKSKWGWHKNLGLFSKEENIQR